MITKLHTRLNWLNYKMKFNFLLILLLNVLLSSCGFATRKGYASYYSDYYEGRVTANGEIFRHSKETAAHKSLPFGTRVEVTNLKNNRSVVVRINDRGPYVKGRIIDLTKTAAGEIGMLGDGVAKVKIRYKKR